MPSSVFHIQFLGFFNSAEKANKTMFRSKKIKVNKSVNFYHYKILKAFSFYKKQQQF